MTEFVSKVENTCKLKLHIPLDIINPKFKNSIYPDLLETIEISGVINFDAVGKVSSVNKNKGSSDSVVTHNNVINYHTHPISAYINANTVWGWPSGEDIRETIKFVLSGNKAHLVFTVEGLYTIQVSPCKIKKIKEMLDDTERGVLIFLIEEYFKSSHNFRGVEEVNKLASKNIFITPYSYIDFVNSFDLINLLSKGSTVNKKPNNAFVTDVGHTGIHHETNMGKYAKSNETFSKIPNVGFPEIEGNYITNSSIKDYITVEELHDLRSVDINGNEKSKVASLKNVKNVINHIKTVFEIIENEKCGISWNSKNPNAWFFMNFFPTNAYNNKLYLNGNQFIPPINVTVDLLALNFEPFIRIFSDATQGCTVQEIAKINKFKIGKAKTKQSSFGKSLLNSYQRNKLYDILKYNLVNPEKISVNQIAILMGLNLEQIIHEINLLNKFIFNLQSIGL